MVRVRAPQAKAVSTRIFVEQACEPDARIAIRPEDARHLALVLRAHPGEPVTIVSNGTAWQAVLEEVSGDRASARILERARESAQLPVPVVVLQALPKGNKMDDVIEKVTELGASRVVPIRCERTYGGDSGVKLERWRRIARAAAAQSQRLDVPTIEATLPFSEALGRFAKEAHVLVAWEQAKPASLARALASDERARALAIVIGPEGSFTRQELEEAARLRCDLVSLGPTILRTETAAAAAIAAVAALRGWW
jgi:16S rRNA (uracil1498-N3)-methyltransferase